MKFNQENLLINIKIVMFSNGKNRAAINDLQTGQTLFSFLKRKKKGGFDTSFHKNQTVKDIYERPSFDKEQYSSVSLKKQNFNSTITPRKVSFKEDSKPGTARTFINMISPIKRKSIVIERDESEKKSSKSILKQKNYSDNYTRKNLNNSLKVVKDTLQEFVERGKNLKEKAHSLAIQLKPLLRILEDKDNKNISRRAEDARVKLCTFEHLFKQFGVQNSNEIMQTFHRNLSEQITSAEANIRSQYELNEVKELNKIRDKKDSTIDSLRIEKQQLEKDLQIMQRRYEKSQKACEDLRYNSQERNGDFSRILEQKVEKYELSISQKDEKIQALNKQINQLNEDRRNLKKQHKDAVYERQEMQKRLLEENTKVKASKEQYLLNQIMILKSQFHAEMAQLINLQKEKQNNSNIVIRELNVQIQQLHAQIKNSYSGQNIKNEELGRLKVQGQKYKKNFECLVTDMHRMNQQLYQHWIALKDIKTLATRLQLFSKFHKIYEDLCFNDRLFD